MLFNSTAVDHARIVASQTLFTSLRFLRIEKTIPNPDGNFTALLQRLTNLEVVAFPYPFSTTRRINSLKAMWPGSLRSINSLTFEHPLFTARLLKMFGTGSQLTTLEYLDSSAVSIEASYVKACHQLIGFLSSASSFPCFKLLVLSAQRPDPGQNSVRTGLLKAAVSASYRHRNMDGNGWRLGMRYSCEGSSAWQCLCRVYSSIDDCFFLDTAEMHHFDGLENRTLKRGGRMEEYLAGFIHVEGTPVDWSSCAFRAGAPTGVQIRVGLHDDIDMVRHAVETCVIAGVSCVNIFLSTLDLSDTQQQNENEDISQDSTTPPVLFHSLQISGPEGSYRRPTPLPAFSFTFQLATSLRSPRFKQLTLLSLPASAFAVPTAKHANCGQHICGYCAHWLESCVVLQALNISDWRACWGCKLAHSDSIEYVLAKWLPPCVEMVRVNGMFLVDRSRNEWRLSVQQEWAMAFAARGFETPNPYGLSDTMGDKLLWLGVTFAREVWLNPHNYGNLDPLEDIVDDDGW